MTDLSPRPYVLGATLDDARAYIAEHPEYDGAGIASPGSRDSAAGRVDVGLPLVMTSAFNERIAAGDQGALQLEAIMKRNAAKARAR